MRNCPAALFIVGKDRGKSKFFWFGVIVQICCPPVMDRGRNRCYWTQYWSKLLHETRQCSFVAVWMCWCERCPPLSPSREISALGQPPHRQPAADHYWSFGRCFDHAPGHCGPAGQPPPSTQKQKARDGAQRKNVSWPTFSRKSHAARNWTFIHCTPPWWQLDRECCKLQLELFTDCDLFPEITISDAAVQ